MAPASFGPGGNRLRTPYVLVTLLLAGCVSVPDPAAKTPESPTGDEGVSDFLPNAFLIDQPRPPGGSVHNGSEPMVLADRDGQYLWVGSTGGAARSSDNGTTWRTVPWPFFTSADGWSFAEDEMGRLYVTTTGVPYVEVYRSDNDGESWHRPGLPIRTPLSGTVDAAPVADRPWIAARGDGEVMLIFYDFGRTISESCVRTTDGGLTWTDRDPMFGSANAGRPDFDESGRFGYVASNGYLYISAVPTLLPRCASPPTLVPMFMSQGAQSQLHTSAAGNAFYSAAPTSGNGAITLAGHKGGTTKRLIVSPPELKANTYATVSARGDEVAVAWYGTETSGNWQSPGFNGSWNVFVARVHGFWTSTPTIEITRLTTEPNHVGDICLAGIGCSGAADRDLLDYFGIDHDMWGGVHVAYAHDGAGSTTQVRYAHLA